MGLKITYKCPTTKKIMSVGAFKHISWWSPEYECGKYGNDMSRYSISVIDCPACKGNHSGIKCLKRVSWDDPDEPDIMW